EGAARVAKRERADARVVCSLRDVVPRTRHEGASADRYADEVLRRLPAVDAIIVHADPRMTTLAQHFPAADRITAPVRYSGLVVEPVGTATDLPTPPWAVASAGGLDATAFLVAVVGAFGELVASGAVPPMPLHVFAPANAPASDVAAIERATEH